MIVSPLLVLMRNQMDMADRLGISAETVNSTNREASDEMFERIAAGWARCVYATATRLSGREWRTGSHWSASG